MQFCLTPDGQSATMNSWHNTKYSCITIKINIINPYENMTNQENVALLSFQKWCSTLSSWISNKPSVSDVTKKAAGDAAVL